MFILLLLKSKYPPPHWFVLQCLHSNAIYVDYFVSAPIVRCSWHQTFRLKLSNLNGRLQGLVIFSIFWINRKNLRLFVLLLIMSAMFLLAPQLWSSCVTFFFYAVSAELKLLRFRTKSRFKLIEVTLRVRSSVQFCDLICESNLFGG